TDVAVAIERIAHLQDTGRGDEAIEELSGDRFLDVQTLQTEAHLSGVGEGRHHGARHREIEIGIGFDDRPRVVADLERHALQAGDAEDVLTHRWAARERYFRGHGRADQRLSGRRTVAVYELEHPVGKAGVVEAFGHADGRER